MKTLALTLLPLALTSCIIAPDAEPSVDIGTDFKSAYVWRGVTFDNGPVIQGDLTVAAPVKQQEDATVGLNIFANMPLSNGNDGGLLGPDDGWDINRADYDLFYSKPFEYFNFTGGLAYYTFPGNRNLFLGNGVSGNNPASGQLYGSFEFDAANLSPTVDVFYDYDSAGGLYIRGGITYVWEWREDTWIEAMTTLAAVTDGYAEYWYGEDDAGLADFVLGGQINHDMGENLVVTGELAFSTLLDNDDVLDDADVDTDKVWIGVGANWSW